MDTPGFHPAVSAWFDRTFAAPTPAQENAWPRIKAGEHCLIAAPTGSGKTLAAFLAAIDDLVWRGIRGDLEERVQVVYVSPLKALSNDIQRNLEMPLAGIREELLSSGLADVEIRSAVRTGDTPQSERERMRRNPPHILVTTPESLYILLTSQSGRRMLEGVRSLIVDEIHAVVDDKRGAHLSLSMARLRDLCGRDFTRVGLSATQKPIETVARYLVGNAEDPCHIVDSGHVRERDLAIEVTGSPLQPVMAGEAWAEIYDRIALMVSQHRTTLIFVNTRRLAERMARHLSERMAERGIAEDAVTSHHGSLAREHRLAAEQRLKAGELRALVATASLELGIDIGDIDLVCQIGSPRAISTLLQRVGRAGHAVGGISRGRIFPTTRDELVESVALLEAVRRGELDTLEIPPAPLDVLAQQIVAEVSCGERGEDELYHLVCGAWPYRELARERFDAVLEMLAAGFATRRGRRGAYIHRDAVNGRLRPRRGAGLTALTNGGAIPDQFDYDVIMQPQGFFVGTLDEDFAFESLPGDIFQLGNTSYRIQRVEQGKVHVEDASGQPPTIPFWFGEAPGRSDELSQAVSRLRARVEADLADRDRESVQETLAADLDLPAAAATQLVDYLAEALAALGCLPTRERIVLERFFDQVGDQHLVIHSCFGSRLNRAWGLALRKRFCRKFNFELQASALEDSIVLSLGSTHSFPLEEVADYLKPETVADVLTQALLDVPMFATQWRRVAGIALAVKRFHGGRKAPAQFQRMDAEDLVALVFPDQLACLENIAGKREIPDHPLVNQSLYDCLHCIMDLSGLETLLGRLAGGMVTVEARDLVGPSPLAQEILTARPYAFLDDGAAEERRTRMVQVRQFVDPEDAARLGMLDLAAIDRVRAEVWPAYGSADELHDALMLLGYLTPAETASPAWQSCIDSLLQDRRATRFSIGETVLWVATERLPLLLGFHPGGATEPPVTIPGDPDIPDREAALVSLMRCRLEVLGPVTTAQLARSLGQEASDVEPALVRLENEGYAMRGRFIPGVEEIQWCERGLLARIHRYTIQRLRDEIRPVSPACFMQFLFAWQGVASASSEPLDAEGQLALASVLEQLEGVEAPAAAWETEILPARIRDYNPAWLDGLCASGRILWARAGQSQGAGRSAGRSAGPVRTTPIALVSRRGAGHWLKGETDPPVLSARGERLLSVMQARGALFFDELEAGSGLLRSQCEEALAELVAAGLVSSDSFIGLRALLLPQARRKPVTRNRRRRPAAWGVDDAGRWAVVSRAGAEPESDSVSYVAGRLLDRYGVVFRKLLERQGNLPPWRDLLYVFRRMEARGEVRGGRFVDGFTGEQFALPDAVGLLRDTRRGMEKDDGAMTVISAADPLNLTGVITPGRHVPSLARNRVLYRDGVPLAVQVGGKVDWLADVSPREEWALRGCLLRRGAAGLGAEMPPAKSVGS